MALHIRVEPFVSQEEHARRTLQQMFDEGYNPNRPLIPAVEDAHFRKTCGFCGETQFWGRMSERFCAKCRVMVAVHKKKNEQMVFTPNGVDI